MNSKILKIIFAILLFPVSLFPQWQSVFTPGSRITSIKKIDTRLYVGTEYTGAWLSKDNGNNWQKLPTSSIIGSYEVNDFVEDGAAVWICSRGGGVTYSADGETNWQYFDNGFTSQAFVSKLILIGDTLFAAVSTDIGLQPSGIYKTQKLIPDWKVSGSGIPGNLLSISSLIITETGSMFTGAQIAGTKGNLFTSNDSGITWQPKFIEYNYDVNALKINSNYIYAGTSNGIYFTTENDPSWIKYSHNFPGYYVDDIDYYNGKLYAAVDLIGAVVTNDDGMSWENISFDLPVDEEYVSKILISDGYLYAGLGQSKGLWRIPISLVDVDDGSVLPENFTLLQNYPNPFNPTTQIKYSIPKASNIQLGVYDLLGSEISILINEYKPAGHYQIEFNAANQPSGVYIYKLQSDYFTSARKMILIK